MYEQKMKIKFIFLVCITCFIIVLLYLNIHSSNDTDIYKIIEKEGIDDNFSFAIVDDELLLKGKIEGIIYFGRDNCQFCRFLNKYLSMVTKENTDIRINKYDTNQWRETDSFREILSKYSVKQIPMLVKVNEDGSYTTFKLSDVDEIADVYEGLIEFIY